MSLVMIILSQKAEDTAPVPANRSAKIFIESQFSFTTLLINGSNLYLLPK